MRFSASLRRVATTCNPTRIFATCNTKWLTFYTFPSHPASILCVANLANKYTIDFARTFLLVDQTQTWNPTRIFATRNTKRSLTNAFVLYCLLADSARRTQSICPYFLLVDPPQTCNPTRIFATRHTERFLSGVTTPPTILDASLTEAGRFNASALENFLVVRCANTQEIDR